MGAGVGGAAWARGWCGRGRVGSGLGSGGRCGRPLTSPGGRSTITASRTSASAAAVSATGTRMSATLKIPQTLSGETCSSLPSVKERRLGSITHHVPRPCDLRWPLTARPQFPRVHCEVEGWCLEPGLGLFALLPADAESCLDLQSSCPSTPAAPSRSPLPCGGESVRGNPTEAAWFSSLG